MKNSLYFILALFCIFTISCSSSSPVTKIQKQMSMHPEYSIILQDMREDGTFVSSYHHQYKIIYAENRTQGEDVPVYQTMITDWYEVDKRLFNKYRNYLGMVVASKGLDGKVSQTAQPPGYQYVGDSRYGRWSRDSSGNSFWEFYGKYAFMSSMFNMFSRPIYRSHYDTYRGYYSSGRPYYGAYNQYGTSGSNTKRSYKSFFNRRTQKEQARKARFTDRFNRRTNRSSMSSFRSRSSGWGK